MMAPEPSQDVLGSTCCCCWAPHRALAGTFYHASCMLPLYASQACAAGCDVLYPPCRYMVQACSQHGVRAVVFNSRGTSDGPVTSPQFYSASYTGDMR